VKLCADLFDEADKFFNSVEDACEILDRHSASQRKGLGSETEGAKSARGAPGPNFASGSQTRPRQRDASDPKLREAVSALIKSSRRGHSPGVDGSESAARRITRRGGLFLAKVRRNTSIGSSAPAKRTRQSAERRAD